MTNISEMNIPFKYIALGILISAFTSCAGQGKKDEQSSTAIEVLEFEKASLPKYGFSDAYVDRDGTLWFSSNGGGIYHYDGKTFKRYSEKDGLSSNQVYSIASDQKNNLWFGTQDGLTKYDRNRFEHIALPYQDTTGEWMSKVYPTLNPNAAHTLATDNDGNLWIGTAGGGAYKYDGLTFKSYLRETGWKYEGAYQNWITHITKDNKGNMWFASMSNGGVYQISGEQVTQYLIEDGLSDNQVRTIFCDRDGEILIGFNGNRNSGLTVYEADTFKTYSLKDGLCNQRINSIYGDASGNLWLGTHLENLCIFTGQNFSEFEYNGQTFPDVMFIIGDLEGNIWFGGFNGIWKYDGEVVAEMSESVSAGN